VLLVEDDVDHRELLRLMLGPRFEVRTAADGLQGYRVACELKPDVIVLDLEMPFVDGHGAFRMLRHNPATRTIPILVVSGHPLHPFPAAPGVEFLRKPFHAGELFDAIQALV
jgi:CheY-like chemotaxis protein